jgi:uncharacterized protein (DUF1800 family)
MAVWLCAVLTLSGVPARGVVTASGPEEAAVDQGQQGGGSHPALCGITAADATRFLEQATFGPTFVTDPNDPNYKDSITHVLQDICFEGWLSEQFNAPVLYPDDPTVPNVGTNYLSPYDPGACDDGVLGGSVCWSPQTASTTCTNNNGSTCNRDNYTAYKLQQELFQNALTGVDQLRQRVAWALSEIDVVSELTIGPTSWMTPYVQLFDRDAFGNFRQLLSDLTVNPAMGEYLNMRGNTKTNVNENYAREILQLFSIGLNELNDDGTPMVDDSGTPVPTYSQAVITAFAHVFTGWNTAAQIAPGIPNYRDPMIVANENNHDASQQTLLDGNAVSGPSSTELSAALDIIFNHHNVGPFIGKQLIQKLVTSNPSPGYVTNVTKAFNTGTYIGPSGVPFGSGTRGDMQATIAAVLLDPEARTAPSDPNYGHLREPVLFITNTLRALAPTGIVDSNGNPTTDFVLGDQFLPSGAGTNVTMTQDAWRAPTVFSYYPPDNVLAGSNVGVGDCGTGAATQLCGPEFAIQSTSTSLAHINMIYDFAYHKMPTNARDRPLGTWIDTAQYEPEAAGDATTLIDDLNMRLMHGSMSQALYAIVQGAVQAIDPSNLTARVQEAFYLIASSSEYMVER